MRRILALGAAFAAILWVAGALLADQAAIRPTRNEMEAARAVVRWLEHPPLLSGARVPRGLRPEDVCCSHVLDFGPDFYVVPLVVWDEKGPLDHTYVSVDGKTGRVFKAPTMCWMGDVPPRPTGCRPPTPDRDAQPARAGNL